MSVEEKFYLVWPFVVFTVKDRKRLLGICVAAVFIVPLLRLWCSYAVPNELLDAGFVERVTPLQADSLLLGAAIALWMRGSSRSLSNVARIVLVVCVVGFVGFEWSWYLRNGDLYVIDISEPIFASLGLSAVNLFSAALVLLAIDATTAWSRFCGLKWLRWLGTVSYGFYVFHDIPHNAYVEFANAFPGANSNPYGISAAAAALVGALLLAWLSFRYFETPFLRLKSRFVSEREPSS